MSRPVVTSAARADLSEIHDFISLDSPSAASQVSRRLHAAIRLIGRSPGLGHLHTHLADEALRVWAEGSYLIICRADLRPVQIVRVLHGARDLGTMLG